MVVIKEGYLPKTGGYYKVYLNHDRTKNKWYLRVTHTHHYKNQHFRAGTYSSRANAIKALATLDPANPKKNRQKKGSVDEYKANGMWRVRIKHRGEHMHIGYFKDKEEAEKKLNAVIKDTEFLEKRYNSLISKR